MIRMGPPRCCRRSFPFCASCRGRNGGTFLSVGGTPAMTHGKIALRPLNQVDMRPYQSAHARQGPRECILSGASSVFAWSNPNRQRQNGECSARIVDGCSSRVRCRSSRTVAEIVRANFKRPSVDLGVFRHGVVAFLGFYPSTLTGSRSKVASVPRWYGPTRAANNHYDPGWSIE